MTKTLTRSPWHLRAFSLCTSGAGNAPAGIAAIRVQKSRAALSDRPGMLRLHGIPVANHASEMRREEMLRVILAICAPFIATQAHGQF
jgi:hypothetical protein